MTCFCCILWEIALQAALDSLVRPSGAFQRIWGAHCAFPSNKSASTCPSLVVCMQQCLALLHGLQLLLQQTVVCLLPLPPKLLSGWSPFWSLFSWLHYANLSRCLCPLNTSTKFLNWWWLWKVLPQNVYTFNCLGLLFEVKDTNF